MDGILLVGSDINILERMLDEVKKKTIPYLAGDCKSPLKKYKEEILFII